MPGRRAAAGRIVELCGLPGSGKSTLARDLLRGEPDLRAGDAGTTAATAAGPRVLLKAGLAAGEALRRPWACLRLVRAVAESGQPSRRDLVANVVQRLVVRAQYRRCRRRAGTWLFEEGLVQTRWTAALRAGRPEALDVLEADDGPPADVVTRIDVPVAVVLERLRTRASRHSRTQGLDRTAMSTELAHGARLLDQLVP